MRLFRGVTNVCQIRNRLFREICILARWKEAGKPFYQITFSSLSRELALVVVWRKVNAALPVHLPLRQANFSEYVRAQTLAGKSGKAGRKLFTHTPQCGFNRQLVRLCSSVPVSCATLKRIFRLSARISPLFSFFADILCQPCFSVASPLRSTDSVFPPSSSFLLQEKSLECARVSSNKHLLEQ